MQSILINTDRIYSLDVFRGLSMALMVLVNSIGTRNAYPILLHASWNGCTLADLVFPSFLFIVGMTTVISLKKHNNQESKAELYQTIIRRTVLLFFLGLLLNAFPKFDLSTIRVYGILQRIALCYFVCSLLYLLTSLRTQAFIFFGVLVGYWYFLTQIPMPGFGADQLSMMRNWVGFVDKLILSPHHMYGAFDPEGFLSTIPSIATTLLGLLVGTLLLSPVTKLRKCWVMCLLSGVLICVAWIWGYSFAINKNLWTSTFVLWTGGLSLLVFSVCFFIIDVLGYTKWALPFKIFGMNALFIFIFHVLLLKIQSMFVLTLPDGSKDFLRIYLAEHLFGSFSPQNMGLFYALLFLGLNFLVAAFLYWRKIFIKI